MASPSAMPTSTPNAKFNSTLGLDGVNVAVAFSTTVRRTGDVSLSVGVSISATTEVRLDPTALAISAARTASGSSTEMVINVVLVDADAVMPCASSELETPSPNAAITGSSTLGVVTRSA